jgi:prepilin-type N-terminal cleavage/methylation domain-containing protein
MKGRQQGFTLIELLVAMTLALVVFGVTLTLFETFNRESLGNSQRNVAQNNARLGLDRIVSQLRNIASPIATPKLLEFATSYELVFQTIGTPSGSNLTGDQRARYCLPNDTATVATRADTGLSLIAETQTWTTASPPAIPTAWTTAGRTCPSSPVPSGVTSTVIAGGVINRYLQRADRPAFSYNNTTAPADLTTVTSVQIDLFVNATPNVAPAETELRSAVFLRNEVRPPVASFTYTATGSGRVWLNGGTSYSPDGYGLTYAWSCTTAGCPAAAALTSSSGGIANWSPGAGTYTVVLTVTDPGGLTSTSTQTVSVT